MDSMVMVEIDKRKYDANHMYGNFMSSHEALGVILEEFQELCQAIHANKLESIRDEAMDLAAVCIRLAEQCRTNQNLRARSVK